jgi:hypothetical protein
VRLERLEDHASNLYPFGIYQDVDGLPILKLSSEPTKELYASPGFANRSQRCPMVTFLLGTLQDRYRSPLEVTYLTKQIVSVRDPRRVHGCRQGLGQVLRSVPPHRCFGNVA